MTQIGPERPSARSEAAEAEFRSLRATILDRVVAMEIWLNQVLSLLLGRDADEQQMLFTEIIWRVPLEVRADQLLRLVESDEELGRFPPSVRRVRSVVKMRNILAHMMPVKATNDRLDLVGIRSGDPRSREIEMAELRKMPKASPPSYSFSSTRS